MSRRITITETRFEKNCSIELSGALGTISLKSPDTIKAVVRISQIGDEFTVYVKAYSRNRNTFRNLESFDSIKEAISSANEFSAVLIQKGFKVTAIN